MMHEKHIQDDLFHSYVLINTICRENKYLTSVKEFQALLFSRKSVGNVLCGSALDVFM